MYRIDFALFMLIDIRQTGRDLVEKCDVCGTVSIPDSVLLRLLIPDVKCRFLLLMVYNWRTGWEVRIHTRLLENCKRDRILFASSTSNVVAV